MIIGGPVLLIDVFSLLFRAHFALPPLSTRAGEPTAALYGLSSLLLKLLREEKPRGTAFALDRPEATFRHAAYAPYKESRPKAEGALPDAERVTALLMAFGFPTFSAPEFEADDILATLARELADLGERPMVVTGDRDCLQVARGPVTVLLVSRGQFPAERLDEAAIVRRYGLRPAQLPDYAALVGDPSDNLPGVPGIGPKTATRLLQRFGSVPSLLEHLAEVEPTRTREALMAHADRVRLWLLLTRLRDDVPLPPGPRYAPLTKEHLEQVRDLFRVLEFDSLMPRLNRLEREGGLPHAGQAT
ncbi:MAG: hypothetical protein HY698_12810 [Deltaproteobacteria bacterium]|nr:hypothetical protein [Deltaproteobacteria bacterium]